MNPGRIPNFLPEWMSSYAGVILLVGVIVNLAAGFTQSTHSLTIPTMRDDLGISYTQAGLMITVAGAVRMGSSFAAGTLAPRYGSRYMIGAGTMAAAIAMLLLGFSPNYLVALGAIAMMGLGSGVSLTPMIGLMAPWFELKHRGLVAGFSAGGGSIAIVVAGLAIPRLIELNLDSGWRHTWYIFGGIVLAIGVVALLFLRDRPGDRHPNPTTTAGQAIGRARRQSDRGAWPLAVYKNPNVWLLAYLGFTSGVASGVFNTFFGSYLTDENGVSLATAGQLLLLVGVLSVACGIIWGKTSDWLGRNRAFGLSFAIQGVGYALFWLVPVMPAFILGSILLGLTMRAAFTLCAAGSGDYVPPGFATAAFALISVGAGLGSTISPIVAGAIADAVGINMVFVLGVGASVMGAAGANLLRAPTATPTLATAQSGDG